MVGVRTSVPAAEAAAQRVRADIFHGRLRPGEHLDEVSLGRRLDVSRNTLREAFRILAMQELVVHEPNRGVFVRTLAPAEAREVYAARRHLECGALREAAVARAAAGDSESNAIAESGWGRRVHTVRAAVEAGDDAAARGDWDAVGSANGDFHLALVALAGNGLVLRMVDRLQTLVRLIFVVADTPQNVHERYLVLNGQIAALVEAGELARAAVALEEYLLRAEDHLVGHMKPLS